MSKFNIALCQLSITSDKERNIPHAREAIEHAAQNGSKLVVLPEIWNCPYSDESLSKYAEEIERMVVGCVCCVFGMDGKLKAKHRKLHLFDVDIPGDITFKESDTLTAGDEATIVDTDVGRIGIGICHNIRFPELAMLYAARGAHLLCYPGAFNMSTGQLLWELMQRARAVDNQLFVATCSPARDTNVSYITWGHSTLVGPFGEIIASTGHEEATVFAEIDYSLIQFRR
ncbi:hypothetical protein AAC387_Pa02g5164 [Persea americana]